MAHSYSQNLIGCVVIYNPFNSVVDNISKYLPYLAEIIVIDNSEAEFGKMIRTFITNSGKIVYVKNPENLGVSTALNTACKIAFDKGYQWILTMDQDSHINDKSFFDNAQQLFSIPNLAIIAASFNNDFNMPRNFDLDDKFLFVDMVITSGNLLSLNAWDKLNGFNEKLFIDEVDNEFCIRAKNNGFKILASKTVYLVHNLGEELNVKHALSGADTVISVHSPLRVYYIVRNNLFIWRKYLLTDFLFVLNRIKNVLVLIFKVTFYFKNKREYFKYMFRGIKDSLLNRYGKFKD